MNLLILIGTMDISQTFLGGLDVKLRKYFLLTTSMLVLSSPAVELIPMTSSLWLAQAEEQQVSDLIALGQSLSDQQQKETLILLGQRQGNKSKYIYVDQTLVESMTLDEIDPQDQFYLSAAVNPEFAQKGVAVDVLTPQNITALDEIAYRNALITAGVRNTSVQLASVESVKGLDGLVGVFEVLNQNGFSLDLADMQVANLELKVVAKIKEVADGTVEDVNDWMTDLKVQLLDQQLNESSENESITEAFIQDHSIQDDLAVQYLYEFAEAFTSAPTGQSEETKEALLSALETPEFNKIQIDGQVTFKTLKDFIEFYEKAMVDNKMAEESGVSNPQYNQRTWRLDKVFTNGFEASYMHPTSNKRQKVDVKILEDGRVQINQKIYDLTSMKLVEEAKERTSRVLPSSNPPAVSSNAEQPTTPLEGEQSESQALNNEEEQPDVTVSVDQSQEMEAEPDYSNDWNQLPMEEIVLEGGFDWDTLWDVADYYQRVMSYNYGFTPDVSDWKLSGIEGIMIHTYSATYPEEKVTFTTYDNSVTITWADGQWINVDNDTLEILDQSDDVTVSPYKEGSFQEAADDATSQEDGDSTSNLSIDATEVIWDLQYMYDAKGLSGYDFILNNELDDWQVLEEKDNSVLLGSMDESGEVDRFVQVTLNGSEYTIEIYEADPAVNNPAAVWTYDPTNGNFSS